MRTNRVLVLGLALLLGAGALLSGCNKQEPPPTTSGYYEGPMKPKGESTTKTDDQINPAGTTTGTSTGSGR